MRHISLGFNTHYTSIKEDFRGVPFLFCVNIVRPAERRSPSAEKPGRDCFVASSHQGAHTPHMPLKAANPVDLPSAKGYNRPFIVRK